METILFVLVVIGLIALYMSFTFVTIPINHLVMVEVNGSPIHIMGHIKDVELMKNEIGKMVPKASSKRPSKAETEKIAKAEANRKRLLEIAETIVTREVWYQNILTFWLVKLCNLHFKHWNPFTTLRKIKVIRTEENPEYDPSKADRNIRDYIINKDAANGSKDLAKKIETTCLRIRWRRVGVSSGRDLKDFASVDLAWSISEVMIVDPMYVFITSPNTNLDCDNQVASSLNNVTTGLTDSEFQDLDTGANTESLLNQFFKEVPQKFGSGTSVVAGLDSIGIRVTGTFSINDYILGGDNEELKKANARKAAAIANLDADKLAAQGKAATAREEGLAAADAIRAKGAATAEATEALKKAIGDDPLVAGVLNTQAYGGNVTTVINGNSPGVILPIPTPPPKKP